MVKSDFVAFYCCSFFVSERDFYMYDVAIIGSGIIGSACAYTLSQYKLKVVMVEKENDVCMGTTKANSAIIHAGFDPKPNTLMAKTNVLGNAMCKEICKKLSVPLKEIGSLVVAFDEEERKTLDTLFQRGTENGVPNMEIWSREKVLEKEPNISEKVVGALWAPTAAIVNPWEMGLAMAETAVVNGCDLKLSFEVKSIEKENDCYTLKSENDEVKAKYVINASGVNTDIVSSMAGKPNYKIVPTVGEYYLLDKSEGKTVSSVVFPCPSSKGKGVLIAPTVHGNLIVGPTATVTENREDTSNTLNGLNSIREKATKVVPNINFRQNIRNFSGVRANSTVDDFIIDFVADNFLELAGIRSPGLSSAPAIAKYATELLQEKGLACNKKDDFKDERKHIRFNELNEEERAKLVQENSSYGRIICRCETITEGEIIDAINSPIPPCSVDGIKRRAGSGMGRCQGGFCGPRVVEILAKEKGISPLEILQDANGSYILTGETKEER